MRTRARGTRRAIASAACVLAVVVAVVVALVGGGVNPANLIPKVAASTTSGTTLYVDFTSVVNLPLGARVLSRGSQIGILDSIDLAPNAARLKLKIDQGIELPQGTTADLRQSTILGDVYVALTPPSRRGGPLLGNNDRIPLSDTDPGPQVEDIVVNLADFMSGGSLLRVQDALRQVNASVEVPGMSLPKAAAVGARDIRELAASTDDIDAMIRSLDQTSTEIASRPEVLGYSFGPEGRESLTQLFNAVGGGFELVAGARDLSVGLNWLTPRLNQLNPFLARLVPLLRTYSSSSLQFNGNSGKLIDLAQDKVAPFVRDGAPVSLDRIAVKGSNSDDTRSVTSVLRMIGALR